MPNRVIVVYEKTIPDTTVGAAFGRYKTVPTVYNVHDIDNIFSNGDKVVSTQGGQYLSGYFFVRLGKKDLEKYIQNNYQPPQINEKELKENRLNSLQIQDW